MAEVRPIIIGLEVFAGAFFGTDLEHAKCSSGSRLSGLAGLGAECFQELEYFGLDFDHVLLLKDCPLLPLILHAPDLSRKVRGIASIDHRVQKFTVNLWHSSFRVVGEVFFDMRFGARISVYLPDPKMFHARNIDRFDVGFPEVRFLAAEHLLQEINATVPFVGQSNLA